MEALRKQAARILREKKKHKLWLTAFLCMAVVVTAGTVTALKMSGQALSHKEKVLICGIEVHQHTEQCRDSEGELVCGQADYVVHVHNDDCKGQDGQLVCRLDEIEPHVHEGSCFAEEKRLICTREESAGHQHDEDCYTKVRGGLTCGTEGAGHQHSAECRTLVQGELTCTDTEEGHEHTDGCYAWSEELTCGQTEEVHEHTDECYAWTEELICEIEEGYDAHEHTDECYVTETVNVCGELELHTHEDSCCDKDGNLICGQTELLEHVHADGCFEIIEAEAADEESGEAQLFQKTYEDAEIRVVAEYDESANIPEEARLVAERIEAEAEGGTQDGSETTEPKTDEADGVQESRESVAEEVSYRLRFLVNEEEVQPGGTVTFTVQGLDENGSDAGEPAVLVYNAGDGLDAMVATLVRETAAEAAHEFRKEARDGNVSVAVEYDALANIPGEAELRVRQITAESDSEQYAQLEAEFIGQTTENAMMDMLFEIGFYVEETRIEPEAPVTITVQIPDGLAEEGEGIQAIRFGEAQTEELDADVLADEAGNQSVRFQENSLSTYAVGRTEVRTFSVRKECRNDALNIIVIAEYNLDAEIPEEAELKVEAITPESNPEYYARREAEYLEQVGESARMDMLLSIGFYDADGAEIEPETPVSITVQLLDDQYEDGEQIKVVHFGNEATEELNASEIRTDEEGNKATSFETDSFSDFGVGPRNGENQLVYCSEDRGDDPGMDGITTFALGRSSGDSRLEDGSSYQIYCQSGGKTYALYHDESHALQAVEVTVDAQGAIVAGSEYTEDGFIWICESNRYGNALKSEDGYYLSDVGPGWTMTNQYAFTSLDFLGNGVDEIGIYSTVASSYLNYENGQIAAGYKAQYTKWKFAAPSTESGQYRINYYKNELSVSKFQDEVSEVERGTLLGRRYLDAEETADGKTVIRIPIMGTAGKNEIGKLDDYTEDGKTYKFYGWSLNSNSNYQPDIGHLIYCGDPDITINQFTVPTYVSDGVITLEVTDSHIKQISEGKYEINLYAIWAAPSNVRGSGSVVYYGTNYKELNGPEDNEYNDQARTGRGVMFFVRLDGQIPNEPGNVGDTSAGGILNRANYTEYVFAKDDAGNKVRNPLKYWMHIYGVQNGDAVEANLEYFPKDEDLLARIKEKNGSIKVAGQIVDFSDISVEDFKKDYYVAWYVCKDGREDDCWHIDGVLLKRTEQWNLVYADNGVTGGTVIPGAQYAYRGNEGDSAMVHNSLIASGGELLQSDIPLEKTGYKFVGWNTSPNGGGISFTAGTYNEPGNGTGDADFGDNDTITVEIINPGTDEEKGQVYKNGEPVEGLYATKNSNGVYEVILYPQWAKGTNLLKVTKTDEAGNVLKGTKFKLYECTLNEADKTLYEGRELTASGGSAINEKGILTIYDLENDTIYCLEESYATNGYEQREKIYFKVQVSEDKSKVMDISIKDVHGEALATTPEWLSTEYKAAGTSGNGGLASIEFKIQDETKFQNVIFMKTDENGDAMSGAKFSLTKKNAESGVYEAVKVKDGSTIKDVAEAESKDSGVIEFAGASTLPYGEYRLEETEAPEGYKKVCVYFEINDPVEADSGHETGMVVTKVEVEGEEVENFDSKDYVVTERSIGDGYQYTLTIKNKPEAYSVALRKLDVDGAKQLGGAEFSLYRETDRVLEAINNGSNLPSEDKVNVIQSSLDEDSIIGELNPGNYYLFEDKVPEGGYIQPTKPVKITVTPAEVKAWRLDNGTTIEQDKTTDESTGKVICVLKIYNSKGITLPETGGPGTVMYTLGGLAVVATSLMYGLSMRRKKEKGGQH